MLIWVPCLFLAVFTPLDLYRRSQSQRSDIPWGFLSLSKSLVLFALICLQFIDLSMMLSVSSDYPIFDVQIVSVGVKAASFVSDNIDFCFLHELT